MLGNIPRPRYSAEDGEPDEATSMRDGDTESFEKIAVPEPLKGLSAAIEKRRAQRRSR